MSVDQKISTDTRKEIKNTLFICLSGMRFDGNLYAKKALELGATYIVTNSNNLIDDKVLYVEDPNETLIQLAKYHSEQIKTKFIAIGGSNGKTTTKELVSAVLKEKFKTQATPGNFNNHIGVPLTLLSVRPDCELAIIELGTNHPGEMAVLCNMFKADTALITNIGLEHLEGFNDIEAVAREESEVYLMAQRDKALAFVNKDDTWLNNMSKRLELSKTYSTIDSSADIFVQVHNEMPFLSLEIFVNGNRMGVVESKLGGRFNAQNIAAAISIGMYYSVPFSSIVKGISEYVPNMNRSQWIETTDGRHIFLDAYNANPSSMEAGIKSFATLEGTKTYLLGDMLELGNHSKKEHQNIYSLMQNMGIEDAFFVGSEFKKALPAFPFVFDNTESLLAWLDTHPIDSDYIYIKGSRGIAMEQCLDHFNLS